MRRQENANTDQRQKFIKAACDLGADENEAAFKAKLAVIARQKPRNEPPIQPASKPVRKRTK
ncbi:MAG: hypothetical protein WBQ75_07985 [Acetobacteraceae bacterium]